MDTAFYIILLCKRSLFMGHFYKQPIVINKDNHLLTGERQLRACESLSWSEIEVRMVDTRDAEHEPNIEISENENRKASGNKPSL